MMSFIVFQTVTHNKRMYTVQGVAGMSKMQMYLGPFGLSEVHISLL